LSLIHSQIATALEQGGTLVVPSRQREVALRLAHTRAQLAAGAGAWPSPDICTWSTWLERCAERARRGSLGGRRRLGRGEEWLLWREAALEDRLKGWSALEKQAKATFCSPDIACQNHGRLIRVLVLRVRQRKYFSCDRSQPENGANLIRDNRNARPSFAKSRQASCTGSSRTSQG